MMVVLDWLTSKWHNLTEADNKPKIKDKSIAQENFCEVNKAWFRASLHALLIEHCGHAEPNKADSIYILQF